MKEERKRGRGGEVITDLIIHWVICINTGCRGRERVRRTHTHTHTHTQEGDRDHLLGGGSRRGLLEPLVVGTVGASGEGEDS